MGIILPMLDVVWPVTSCDTQARTFNLQKWLCEPECFPPSPFVHYLKSGGAAAPATARAEEHRKFARLTASLATPVITSASTFSLSRAGSPEQLVVIYSK